LPHISFRKKETKTSKFARKFGEARTPRKWHPEVPPSVAVLTVIAISVFLLGGGLYSLLQSSPAIVSSPSGGWSFYVPYDLNTQTLSESIFFTLFLCVGIAGGYVAYRSFGYRHGQRQASILLLVAVIMIAIAAFGVQFLLELKVPSL